MSSFRIHQDQKRCIGCRACEVHCKTENDLPVGLSFCKIIPAGPKLKGGIPRIKFIFRPCFHCDTPLCVAACPTGAIQKRAKDGIVFIDPSLCAGCKDCITACPWSLPQWNQETGTTLKCDYCKDRVDKGLEPACVTGCTTAALKWVSRAESTRTRRKLSPITLVETKSGPPK